MLGRLLFYLFLAVVISVVLGAIGLMMMTELGPIFALAFIFCLIWAWFVMRSSK